MWAYLQHLFLPHHTNNHRPKALHLDSFLLYITFFLFLQFGLSFLKNNFPNIWGVATDINVERLLVSTNQKRTEAGLAPLNLDPTLSQAAAGKAQDMFGKNYWAHNSPDGLTPWVFIKGAGYNYLYAGENLAKNFTDSDGVVSAWIASSTHRENILNPKYQDIGFAVVNGRLNGEETTLVVQLFGVKQPLAMVLPKKIPSASSPEVATSPEAVSKTETPVPVVSPKISPPTATALAKIPATTLVAAVKTKPLLNAPILTKNFVLIFAAILIVILGIDGFLIWRKQIVRLSGHNLAHLIFLTGVWGNIWFTKPTGVIL